MYNQVTEPIVGIATLLAAFPRFAILLAVIGGIAYIQLPGEPQPVVEQTCEQMGGRAVFYEGQSNVCALDLDQIQ